MLAREMNFDILEWGNSADERSMDEDFGKLRYYQQTSRLSEIFCRFVSPYVPDVPDEGNRASSLVRRRDFEE